MKKVALSLAGLLAAAAFAPEASALPVFARQTGMACNACHFQHFPLLNGFGRAFKSSGFTMIGAQAKVEGDSLSLPAVVNAAVLTSMGYEKTNATPNATVAGATAGTGPWSVSQTASGASTGGFYVAAFNGEASLFLGGRGSDFMGFLTEVTMGGGAAAADSFKTPILVDLGSLRAGVVFFTTNGQGASYGFETMNTGANAIHSITNTVGFQGQYINAVSAQQYIGTGAAATGASIVGAADFGFVNVTKFVQAGPGGGAVVFAPLSSTYLRAAYTGSLGDWDAGLGVQNWRGQSLNVAPVGLVNMESTKATAIDGQLQGAVGGMPLGVYFSAATAPANTDPAVVTNAFNGNTLTRSSFNIDAELGVVPEKVTVGGAIRRGKSGVDQGLATVGVANGVNATDNAIYLTATYKLAQNLLARLSYVTQSGTFWDLPAAGAGVPAGATVASEFGKRSTTLNLYALF